MNHRSEPATIVLLVRGAEEAEEHRRLRLTPAERAAEDSHPSSSDQLMARALGVCWHSPASDRWPCATEVAR